VLGDKVPDSTSATTRLGVTPRISAASAVVSISASLRNAGISIPSAEYFFAKNEVRQKRLFSTKAPRSYVEADYEDECYLFFGRETKGLPEDFLEANFDDCVRIPMRHEARSLNLSNSVAVAVFEALRQQDFPHLQDFGKMKI